MEVHKEEGTHFYTADVDECRVWIPDGVVQIMLDGKKPMRSMTVPEHVEHEIRRAAKDLNKHYHREA